MVMFACARFLPAEELQCYPDIYQIDTDGDAPIAGIDLSHGYIDKFHADDMLINCNFEGTTFGDAMFSCDKSCNLKDAWFQMGCLTAIPQEILIQTRNFKMKHFCHIQFKDMVLQDVDFSNFCFEDIMYGDVKLINCNFENAYFTGTGIGMLPDENLRQTWNFKNRDFRKLNYFSIKNADLSGSLWGCDRMYQYINRIIRLGADVDLTDAVFVLCDLRRSSELTPEQVKSTWNYKNNRMELVNWPEHIRKALNLTDPSQIKPKSSITDPQGYLADPARIYGDTSKLAFGDYSHLYFEEAEIEIGKFSKTLNHHYGIFEQCRFFITNDNPYKRSDPLFGDFSKIIFVECDFDLEFTIFYQTFGRSDPNHVLVLDITDSVFIDCDLSKARNITLEQVKSTWNYKAGRMSLCKWPEHIEKALEEEEKAKAQEEKK